MKFEFLFFSELLPLVRGTLEDLILELPLFLTI